MRIYVGTYHKYNSGSLNGKWLDVEDYADKADFHAACAELHKDESDPEYMFQDHEDIPSKYISESHVAAELWDEFVKLTEDEREIVQLYCDNVTDDTDTDQIIERFEGTFDSGADYCADFIEQTGELKNLGWLAAHIDYDSIWREWQHDKDSFRHDGKLYVFRND